MINLIQSILQMHDSTTTIVAVGLCWAASTTAFALAHHVCRMRPCHRAAWICGLTAVTGAGIWSTHFVAILANHAVDLGGFDLALTLGSMVVALSTAGLGWRIALRPWPGARYLAGAILGGGVVMMHFVAMAGLELPVHMHNAAAAAKLGLCCIALSILAFHCFDTSAGGRPWRSGAALALAILTLHFGEMGTMTVEPPHPGQAVSNGISAANLAFAVSTLVVTLLVVALATLILESRYLRAEREEAQRLKTILESAEALAIAENGEIVDANQLFWQLAGYGQVAPIASRSIELFFPAFRSDLDGRFDTQFIETQLATADGQHVDVMVALRRAVPESPQQTLLLVRDNRSHKVNQARMTELTRRDPLTGLLNRGTFGQRVQDALRSVDEDGLSSALLCLDLDRFQAMNELYGHSAGDLVLVEIARRLAACLDSGEILARTGGDEFAILQQNAEQPQRAAQLARRILASISAPMKLGQSIVQVHASIGIAFHPGDARQGDELIDRAELALHAAKLADRGSFRFFDDMMNRMRLLRQTLEADLEEALAAGQFRLAYQPIADASTEQVVGFEALLRWDHPSLGEISPDVFIPIAEETKSIRMLGTWAMRQACREAASWQRPLRIAVNLSPVQFEDNLVDSVARILHEEGLAPERLDIEVTEGLLIRDGDSARATLLQLGALGIGISMDDFGTGYSSLSYVRKFPFGRVKIDRSFVRDMTSDDNALAIVRAVIGLAGELGLTVLAEGVETDDQLHRLRDMGCREVQGYGIARPASITRFAEVVGKGDDSGICAKAA